jgi:hypothetical protein
MSAVQSGYLGPRLLGILRSGHTALTSSDVACNSRTMELRRVALFIAIAGLFANSLDCYGAGILSQQARECCNSGHCSAANPDPCCKTAPSGAHQALVSQPKVHVDPVIVMVAVVSLSTVPLPSAMPGAPFVVGSDLPPPPKITSQNLPLLI